MGLPGSPGALYIGEKGEMGYPGVPGADGTWEEVQKLQLKGPPGDFGRKVPNFYDFKEKILI